MTVYSGVLNSHTKYAHFGEGVKIEHSSVFKLNLILLLIAGITIAAYVFISNLMVARKYALNLRKSEISQLNAKLAAEDQQYGGENLETLLRFAKNYGLVEAKDNDSILEKDGFAVLP